MSTEYFNKDFANQFREECALYTAVEEFQNANLLFRQFAGNSTEIESLAVSVTKKLYNATVIYRLLNKLQNEDLKQVCNLCKMVKNLHDEFLQYIRNEPYTCGYYTDLIRMLASFYELADAFKNDVCEQGSNTLIKAYAALHTQRSDFDFDGIYSHTMAETIGYYINNMLIYYNHFLVIWQNEKDNKKGIQLTTQVADYLSKLICSIEQVISGMEDTLDLFLTWEVQMDTMEDQALFN